MKKMIQTKWNSKSNPKRWIIAWKPQFGAQEEALRQCRRNCWMPYKQPLMTIIDTRATGWMTTTRSSKKPGNLLAHRILTAPVCHRITAAEAR